MERASFICATQADWPIIRDRDVGVPMLLLHIGVGEGRAQRGDGGGRRAGPCAESPGRPRDGLDSAWLTVLDSDLLLSA